MLKRQRLSGRNIVSEKKINELIWENQGKTGVLLIQ